MKVVHVSAMDSGGAGKAAHRLHTGLRAAGVDSAMVVVRKGGADPTVRTVPYPWYRLLSSGGRSPRARWKRISRRWDRLLRDYPDRPVGVEMFTDAVSEYRFWDIREIREADIVHLHWVAGILDYEKTGDFLSGKRIVWTLHDSNPFTGGCHVPAECGKFRDSCGRCPQLGSDDPVDLSYRTWKTKEEFFRRLDLVVVTPSRWLGRCASESHLLARFPVHVIPNGVPTQLFRPYEKAEARRSLGLPVQGNVILFGAAYVTRWKGFDHLHDAVHRLPGRIRENSVLISFGPLKGIKWPEAIRTRNFGPVSDQGLLARLYSAADAFVIPSLYENLPNTILESLSCGTPVVGFSSGGVPEIVVDGVTGKVASPADPGGLAEAIAWVLDHSDTRGLPERCREVAVREHAQDVQAERYRELYRNLRPGA